MISNIKVVENDLIKNLNSLNCLNNFVVHSVFTNVLNLSNGKVIISVQNQNIPKTPMAFVIDGIIDYTSLDLKINQEVYLDNRKVLIGNNIFNINSYELWDSKLNINIYKENIVKIIEILNKVIKGFGKLDGLGKGILYYKNYLNSKNNLDQINSIALNIFIDTVSCLANEKVDDATLEIKKLIGLGLGLTPSGDDFLIGLLSVLHTYEQQNTKEELFLSKLKENILKDLSKTNFISSEFLRYACLGKFSETFHSLLGSIKREDYEEIYINAIKFVKVGHSSGTDGLAGILFGLYLIKDGLL